MFSMHAQHLLVYATLAKRVKWMKYGELNSGPIITPG